MSEGVYVKTFGAYGVAPAKIFPDKDGQFLTWKTVEKTKDNYTYNEQYCMFRLVTSIYDGKNKYGTAKYKNGNVIYVKIKDINLYNLLKSMEIKNAKFYNFYGSVVVSNYDSYTHTVKNEDGSIKKDKKGNNLVETLLRTEWCLLNDYNAKIIPFYDEETTPVTQNTELQESENINDEIKNDPYDDDIPF